MCEILLRPKYGDSEDTSHDFSEEGNQSTVVIHETNHLYFYCYTVHVVELLNYYTNHCTYIKFTH